MTKRRAAVTHADLAPTPRIPELGSKTGLILVVLTILCGLCCFILCLIAEATRSQMTWMNSEISKGNNNGDDQETQCVYSGSGKTPLSCAAVAFVGLAAAMVVEHLFILIAISKSPSPALDSWNPDNSAPAKCLTWQAGFFFVSTWICFAVGEILLLIGLSVESGHLNNWARPRPKTSCLILKGGLFSAAGVFSLITVFLATGLYLTALRAQKFSQEMETVQREVLETSTLYATPPRSPPVRQMAAIARENPLVREQLPPSTFPSAFGKEFILV